MVASRCEELDKEVEGQKDYCQLQMRYRTRYWLPMMGQAVHPTSYTVFTPHLLLLYKHMEIALSFLHRGIETPIGIFR